MRICNVSVKMPLELADGYIVLGDFIKEIRLRSWNFGLKTNLHTFLK